MRCFLISDTIRYNIIFHDKELVVIFFVSISAARRQNGGLIYLMQTKKNTVECVTSGEARRFWPTMVASFLEKRVEWRMPPLNMNRRTGFENIQNEAELQDRGPHRISCNHTR